LKEAQVGPAEAQREGEREREEKHERERGPLESSRGESAAELGTALQQPGTHAAAAAEWSAP
jgi:hypothetical protein